MILSRHLQLARYKTDAVFFNTPLPYVTKKFVRQAFNEDYNIRSTEGWMLHRGLISLQ